VLIAAQRRASTKVARTIFFMIFSPRLCKGGYGPNSRTEGDERRSVTEC
jgi:hypothetical protein